MFENANRSSTIRSETTEDSPRPPNKARVAVATMFTVGGASLIVQLLAISSPQFADQLTLGAFNGPGLIAIVSGWVMAARCRSWEFWKKWIWLPTTIGTLSVLLVMGITAQSIAKESEEEAAREAQIAAECSALRDQLTFRQSKMSELRSVIDEAVASTASRRAFNAATGRESPSWDQPDASPISTSPFTTEGRARLELTDLTADYDRIFSRYDARC